jgi:AICAR transformylase/IMP cyclohydrolase PurH
MPYEVLPDGRYTGLRTGKEIMRIDLRYGLNPQDTEAYATAAHADRPPITVISGTPSYVNLLDALNAWSLVNEASGALGELVAASFKHVSPAGVATSGYPPPVLHELYHDEDDLTAAATAYLRARGVDPRSSYGDFVAISGEVDACTARMLKKVVSDGIIAPAYAPGVVSLLSQKKGGRFLVIEVDPRAPRPEQESRDIMGLTLTQRTDRTPIGRDDLIDVRVGRPDDDMLRDALLGLATIRYTQSNSVAFVYAGQAIAIAAGQQSRIDGTRLAGAKADRWHLLRHPKVGQLEFKPDVTNTDRVNWRYQYVDGFSNPQGVDALNTVLVSPVKDLSAQDRSDWLQRVQDTVFVSDGFIPFRDNIDALARHGVACVVAPRGSIRDDDVVAACHEHGMALVYTKRRFFHH